MPSSKDNLFTKACKFLVSDYAVLVLFAIAFFLSMWHVQTVSYPEVPHYLDIPLRDLEGESVTYPEPNNVGPVLMVYPLYKLTGFAPGDVYLLCKLVGFIALLIIFYKLTESWKLTLLSLGFAPVLINAYLLDNAIVAFFILLAIYLYLKGSKTLAYLCSIPMVLFRHEGLMLFASFMLYEILWVRKEKSFTNKITKTLIANWTNILILVLAACGYMLGQYYFYGHPLANLVLNLTATIELNYPWYTYAIRYAIYLAMAVTSVMLYNKNKLLFTANTCLTIVYFYFGFLGSFEYVFFNVQSYYCWLWPFTVLAIAYVANDPAACQNTLLKKGQ